MKIHVGLGYDSRKPNNQKAQFNTLVCGELGLLTELEFRAGLSVAAQNQAQRIVRFMQAIEQSKTPDRFYAESFDTDPLACTEELLRWNDWLSLYGWQLLPNTECKGRLADLAEIRRQASTMFPNVGERIFSLLDRLSLVAKAITSIELVDPISHWEPIYQHLFAELQNSGISIVELAVEHSVLSAPQSDLGKLQQAIISNSDDNISWNGDGSLRCYTSNNLQTAASFVIQAAKEQHLIIASGQHYALNAAAIHNDFAEPGLGESSALRAPNQLLPLMLQCLWSPPSAQIVQQYLTLSAGKHQRLRRRLARHFADQPGYDVPVWEQFVAEFVASEVLRDPNIAGDALRQNIADWLPIGKANSADEMDVNLAIDSCALIKKYWLSLTSTSEEAQRTSIYSVAIQGAEALFDALGHWPQPTISKDQLNRLLDIVADVGNSIYKLPRKVSALDIVESPESTALVRDTPRHLFWWDCKLTSLPSVPPLSDEELSCAPLYRADENLREQRHLARSLTALLNVDTSVTLVSLNDSPDLLKLSLTKLMGENCWQSLDKMLLSNRVSDIATKNIKDLSFPAEQRWWNLDMPVPALREKESYSSLSALALVPHEYVLRYSAKLTQGALVSLPFDARMKGNLSHKIVEHWLQDTPWRGVAPSEQEIDSWLAQNLDDIIFACALPLAASGMRSQRVNYENQIRHAMVQLFTHLAHSDIQDIRVEHKIARTLSNNCIEGTIDLLCQLSDGRWVIIDMKWGSRKRYSEELSNGLYLQLATYAYLADSLPPKQVADIAYFIISEGALLTTTPHVFANAIIVEPANPEHRPKQVWSAFKNTFEWRLQQFQNGLIEVIGGSSEQDPCSSPADDCLPVLTIEASKKPKANYAPSAKFKRLDTWRMLTGNIKE